MVICPNICPNLSNCFKTLSNALRPGCAWMRHVDPCRLRAFFGWCFQSQTSHSAPTRRQGAVPSDPRTIRTVDVLGPRLRQGGLGSLPNQSEIGQNDPKWSKMCHVWTMCIHQIIHLHSSANSCQLMPIHASCTSSSCVMSNSVPRVFSKKVWGRTFSPQRELTPSDWLASALPQRPKRLRRRKLADVPISSHLISELDNSFRWKYKSKKKNMHFMKHVMNRNVMFLWCSCDIWVCLKMLG